MPPQKVGWRPRPVILSVIIVGLTVGWLLTLWTHTRPSGYFDQTYKSTLRREPIEYLKQPIYYPDLGQLAQYRAGHMVKLANGQDVESHKVSYLYKGSKATKLASSSNSKDSTTNGNTRGDPPLVLVVGIRAKDAKELLELVVENRRKYAEKHQYGLYIRYLDDFDMADSEDLTKAALMRDAMAAFPTAEWMWYLEQDAAIMNMDHDIYSQLLTPEALNPQMIRGAPVVPPQSEVHTYKRVPASNIEFVCAQNDRGLSSTSFFVKNTRLYGQILMEFWSDPLQRQYVGFKTRNEGVISGQSDASLTHLVQWHPLLFSRMAVVPAKAVGSWIDDGATIHDQQYANGDFVAILHSTNEDTPVNRDVVLGRWHSLLNQGTIKQA